MFAGVRKCRKVWVVARTEMLEDAGNFVRVLEDAVNIVSVDYWGGDGAGGWRGFLRYSILEYSCGPTGNSSI